MAVMLPSCIVSFFFFRENTYVRAVGHLKSFKENSRSLIAFSLSPVLDFNEITHHMFDIIHSHLAMSKVMNDVWVFFLTFALFIP